MRNKRIVLDASALLAFLQDERGADVVYRTLTTGDIFISSVNLTEVVAHLKNNDQDMNSFDQWFSDTEIDIVPFDKELAWQTGLLKARANKLGMSLADCACLTLSKHLHAIALTADTAWHKLKADFNVEFIR